MQAWRKKGREGRTRLRRLLVLGGKGRREGREEKEARTNLVLGVDDGGPPALKCLHLVRVLYVCQELSDLRVSSSNKDRKCHTKNNDHHSNTR